MSFENGRQTPSRTRINAILQRLGLPDDRYYALVTPEELEIEALKKEIVACNALKHVNEGFDKISQLEKIVKPDYTAIYSPIKGSSWWAG